MSSQLVGIELQRPWLRLTPIHFIRRTWRVRLTSDVEVLEDSTTLTRLAMVTTLNYGVKNVDVPFWGEGGGGAGGAGAVSVDLVR